MNRHMPWVISCQELSFPTARESPVLLWSWFPDHGLAIRASSGYCLEYATQHNYHYSFLSPVTELGAIQFPVLVEAFFCVLDALYLELRRHDQRNTLMGIRGGKVYINHQFLRDISEQVQTASQASDKLSFSTEKMTVPQMPGCWLQFSGDIHTVCRLCWYPKGNDSLPRTHSQDLAREGYMAFQTQEKQLNKLWVKVVKTKTLHLIRTGKGVPHTQPALLWGNTELLSALMPQKLMPWYRMEGDKEKMTVWKRGSELSVKIQERANLIKNKDGLLLRTCYCFFS